MEEIRIGQAHEHVGQQVAICGWVHHLRDGGRVRFLELRDGTGLMQVVGRAADMDPATFERLGALNQETAITVVGTLRADPRAKGGYEISLQRLEVHGESVGYPIGPKEHGPDFLMDHRHLWIRSPRQAAILRLRAQLLAALRGFLDEQGFVETQAPILTPSSCEGTTELFETDYFDQKAYLSQSGQLYAEAAAMALGRVYTLGPTFRAERSKTRKHLIEFWMLEPEAAFLDFEGNLDLQERLICSVVQRLLERCAAEFEILGREVSALARIQAPFPRVSYREALDILARKGYALAYGEDFGAPHEAAITEEFDKPVFVHRPPTKIKAFYMQPDPLEPELALAADLLAPDGYGEIIGGSERIHDLGLLEQRLAEHQLSPDDYAWYLDLRRYGSVVHSGFGLGIERTLAWLAGLEHVRESIAFPRLLYRLYP